MLDKFEQKILIKYFLKTLKYLSSIKYPAKRKSYLQIHRDNVFKTRTKIINDCYQLGLIPFCMLNGETDLVKISENMKDYRIVYEETIKNLKTLDKSLKNSKISNMEKNLRKITHIYNLNNEEYQIFSLITRFKANKTFYRCLDLKFKDDLSLVKCYIKDSPTLLESYNKLLQLGLIINSYRMAFEIEIDEELNNRICQLVTDYFFNKNKKDVLI